MNTSDNISMNSSRPYEPKLEKSINYKEMIQDKEEKIKELSDKNEKLEKECLRFQIQLKTLEQKLKVKQEKEYIVKQNYLIIRLIQILQVILFYRLNFVKCGKI